MQLIALTICCRVLLYGMELALGGLVKEELARLRKGRGNNDHFFVLRHLMQQTNEMTTG